MKALMFLCLGAAAGMAHSQPVFGLDLGQQVSLPECEFKRVGSSPSKLYDQFPPKTCAQDAHALNGYGVPVRTMVFGRNEAPGFVKNSRAFLLEDGGRLVGVHFVTPGLGAQSTVMEQLQAKYGPATSVSNRQVKNLAGAAFEAISAEWRGGAVDVTFDGVADRFDRGHVYLDLPRGTALRSSWQKDEAAKERKL